MSARGSWRISMLALLACAATACGRRQPGSFASDAATAGPVAYGAIEAPSAPPARDCGHAVLPGGAPAARTVRSETSVPSVKVEYPEIAFDCADTSAIVNAALAAEPKRREAEWRHMFATELDRPYRDAWYFAIHCSAATVSARIVSVGCYQGELSGGAHPMWGQFSITLAIDGPRVRELRLDDLFLPRTRPAFVTRVKAAANEVKRQRGSDLLDDATVDRALKSFTLGPQSLTLLFSDYELGPHIDALPMIEIPYAQLADLLVPGGPVSTLDGR